MARLNESPRDYDHARRMSFIGEVNQGYVVFDQRGTFVPNQSDAVVLASNPRRDFHRFVTWRAARDGQGRAVYHAGNYHSDLASALADLDKR